MSKLEELIERLCPNGVEYKKLESCLKYEQPTKYIVKSTKYDDSYDIPVLTAGQTFILGYTNETNGIYIASKKEPTIIFDDFTTGFHWVDFGFKVKSSAMKILRPINENVNFRYIYYAMSCIKFEPGTHTRHWISIYSQLTVPVPPLEVQCEIVRILDDFTELSAELKARQKQYEYYRNEILKFENEDVEYKSLDEIATDMYRGAGIKRDEVTEDGIDCVRYGEIYTSYNITFDNCISHTDINKIKSKKYFEYGDVLFAITGESVEEIGKSIVYLGQNKCLAGGDIVVMKHKQNPKYLAYVLSTTNAQMQKSKGKVKSKVVHSSVPALKEIVIPIPTLDKQEKIANILEKFYELTNNISEGLPAEIEARQKQYEYYRDKLLTFKELKEEN
ncbi:MAG: restriction endonuclease subunit S [Clostridia bacterium]|nr:restriction endonuclease subunit S [Clostridia bacterium]